MHHSSTARAAGLAIALLLVATTISAFFGPAGAAGPGRAEIGIQRSHVMPARQETSTGSGRFTVTLILENRGNASGVVRLTLSDPEGTFLDEFIEVTPNKTRTVICTWTANGTGTHNATATLSGENATSPLTADLTCELAYIPVEHPSPWYTIPCAFMVIIIPSVAIWLLIRRMKGGEWLEKTGGEPGNRGAGEPGSRGTGRGAGEPGGKPGNDGNRESG